MDEQKLWGEKEMGLRTAGLKTKEGFCLGRSVDLGKVRKFVLAPQ